MELKQLEYFMVACEKGSFNQAAECLYTSQPNVSKVIGMLEQELGRALFERTSRGLRVTPYGETVREYAHNILNHVSLINSLAEDTQERKFTVSTYPSNMIARLLTDFYKKYGCECQISHREGSVEEISDQVSQGISELGIVYVAQKQVPAFRHILSHKKLSFQELDVKPACVYVGPNHPRYEDESIDFTELPQLKFVSGIRDFFSMEHHLNHVSLGAISTDMLNTVVHTNSDHMTMNLLMQSDICSLGIDFVYADSKQYPIRNLKIRNSEPFLVIGYIYQNEEKLSAEAAWFLEHFKKML